jgi:hypothetical protein
VKHNVWVGVLCLGVGLAIFILASPAVYQKKDGKFIYSFFGISAKKKGIKLGLRILDHQYRTVSTSGYIVESVLRRGEKPEVVWDWQKSRFEWRSRETLFRQGAYHLELAIKSHKIGRSKVELDFELSSGGRLKWKKK